MAFNPQAWRAQMLKKARALRASQGTDTSHADDSLHLQLLALERDVKRLREQSPRIADRIAMKRNELLPKWRPYAERYLEAGEVYPYPVLVYCVIWLFDVGELDEALAWADIAIEQGQEMPGNIRTRLPAFVADQVLAWSMREAQYGHSIEPYFSTTFTRIREQWRLHEKIMAKWFKFAGEFVLRDRDGKPTPSAIEDIPALKQAAEYLAQAEGFHSAIGVTTLRRRVNARIRALEKAGEA